MGDTILAYDLGTGGNKASLFDSEGGLLATSFVSYETIYPAAGWHEQRPDDWWRAIVESTRQLLAARPGVASSIAAIGISGHSLGVVPISDRGELLRETTPIWSDTRAEAEVDRFFERMDRARWYLTTGNGFPPACYSVFKLMWYTKHEPEMMARVYQAIGTKDYINLRLTGRVATDYSYASGSGVFNLAEWRYSEELISASDLPRRLFPEPSASTEVIGVLTGDAAELLGLRSGTPVVGGGVDNSCMALGAGNIEDGRLYTSLGSSSWIAVSSRKPLLDPVKKPFVFAHVVPELYTSAVSIFAAGSSFRWIRDNLLCFDGVREELYPMMTRMAAESPPGANGLLFNPSLAGGSSQEPSPHIRGAFAGIDLRHTRNDLVRAAMEGIALNLGVVLEVLRSLTSLRDEVLFVGGGSKSRLWRQIFADVFRMKIVKTSIDQETASLGAAALAAVGIGMWRDFEMIDRIHKVEAVAEPDPTAAALYRKLLPAFELLRTSQAELAEKLRDLDLPTSTRAGS
ncbi:MAG TPA: FGGY-family carbohydrate kinase [Spirochaetia bacterium]|nr:FGGY-family carbohydrate kinase [Spirochaetia bacterium]